MKFLKNDSEILEKNVCMFLLTDIFILCVKNPELQPFTVYSCEGLRWTQVAAFVVSLYTSIHCGALFQNMFHTLIFLSFSGSL